MLTKMSKGFWDMLWRLWYPLVTRFSGKSSVIFLNYGYADDGARGNTLLLNQQDEPDRNCIQLYHHVASTIDLFGLDVLEVSCGHGGGASFIARYLQIKSMRGVDRNAKAIELCQKRHHTKGLTFSLGNALDLAFDDNTFDAVVNVEASHCYPDVPQFYSEVQRVLRPGGHFLYADFRQGSRNIADLQRQLEDSGFEIIGREDISSNVVRGMQLNTEKYLDLIRRLFPRILRKPAMAFAGVPGSAIYKALESGETVYLCYHLRKATPD
jgi:ubiquinone/menaquinone biosynthesis C-methylase UbiE